MGNFTNHVPIGDDFQIEVRLFRKNGDDMTPFRVEMQPFCSFYRDDIYFVPEFIESSNLPPREDCPIEKVKIFIFELADLTKLDFSGNLHEFQLYRTDDELS